jgi:flagellar export protein FliJ
MATTFRLATLLRLRERERDTAAKSLQDVREAIDKLNNAKAEIDEANASMDQMRKQAIQGTIALTQVLEAQRYQLVLAAQVSQILENMSVLNQERQRREAVLLKCQQAIKSLEKLRTQRSNAADTLALAKQQDRLDEWSSIRHAVAINANVDSHERVEEPL